MNFKLWGSRLRDFATSRALAHLSQFTVGSNGYPSSAVMSPEEKEMAAFIDSKGGKAALGSDETVKEMLSLEKKLDSHQGGTHGVVRDYLMPPLFPMSRWSV